MNIIYIVCIVFVKYPHSYSYFMESLNFFPVTFGHYWFETSAYRIQANQKTNLSIDRSLKETNSHPASTTSFQSRTSINAFEKRKKCCCCRKFLSTRKPWWCFFFAEQDASRKSSNMLLKIAAFRECSNLERSLKTVLLVFSLRPSLYVTQPGLGIIHSCKLK